MIESASKIGKRVLIIELNVYHGHVIYPQIVFLLRNGYDVTVLIHQKNTEIDLLRSVQDQIELIEIPYRENWRTIFSLAFRHFFQSYAFVVFNTIETNRQALFALLHRGKLRFLIHNLERMVNQPPQRQRLVDRLMRRAERMYVLSEHIYDKALDILPNYTHDRLRWFHPSFFDGYRLSEPENTKSDKRIRFAIVGFVDGDRRNYEGLANIFEALANSPLREQITIQIMGDVLTDDGRKLLLRAAQHNDFVGTVIEFQEERFQPFGEFSQRLQQAQFILPLIDKSILNTKNYNQTTVPSSFMLSRAFGIPLVVSDDVELDEDLTDFAIPYSSEDLLEGLKKGVEFANSQSYPLMRTQYQAFAEDSYEESAHNYLE